MKLRVKGSGENGYECTVEAVCEDGTVIPFRNVLSLHITPEDGVAITVFADDPDIEWELPREVEDCARRLNEIGEGLEAHYRNARLNALTRHEAIALARVCAAAKPESYHAEPFQPHEWVIDAIQRASRDRPEVTARTLEAFLCCKPMPSGDLCDRNRDHAGECGNSVRDEIDRG